MTFPTFPTALSVGHHVYADGTPDANNTPVPMYTPARDRPGIAVSVIGWDTPKSVEPHVTGHDTRVDVTVKLFAPPSFRPGPRDLIDIPGVGQCEVMGVPEVTDGNPFRWVPGSTIELRRVTG